MEQDELPIVGHTKKEMMLDWDGKLVVTIFLPRCNMKCSFCHSHALIDPGDDINVEGEAPTLELLKKHSDFYDGICVTGGEPTLHDLEPFFKKVKKIGMKVKLDTNGSNPDRLKNLVELGLVDYVAMDYKAPLDRMEEVCRGSFSLDKVRQSIEFLRSDAVDYEFRTTAVPALHTIKDLERIVEEISGSQRWVLQRFRGKGINGEWYIEKNEAWLLETPPYEDGVLETFLESVAHRFKSVKLRG